MKRKPIRIAARPAFSNEGTNPYNSLLYGAVSSAGPVVREHRYSMLPWGCDIVHLHWPEFDLIPRSLRPIDVLKKLFVWTWLLSARVTGVKIVWTAHNAFGHDMKPSRINLFLWKRFLSMLDGVIFLSEESQSVIRAAYPSVGRVPSALIKHGHYGPWIDAVRAAADAPAREVVQALERLEGAFVVLNFGQMRAYKNVDELMRQFSMLDDPDIRLLIAGSVPDADYRLKLDALAAADRRIVLLPRHLDDASLAACLDRADLVVLPYRKILNSGSALMALSVGRHVVVPAIGSMRALQRDVGSGALTLFEGPFDADILRDAIDRVKTHGVTSPYLEAYEWPLLGDQTVRFYRDVLGGRS
ncbi:MAG: glycosyltransferase [Thiobacillus sp.]|uniref:glycosyltransferase n=1 Tax=Thiobacillus sp. TaxID=924 RepID=UPI00289537FC|nr:glycosyltransferase [Thiobacillus sp.]MDT3706547.1 glycosyltransferase [Thiobacillus sp.]